MIREALYPIQADLSNSEHLDRLYYRKGVQVDRIQLGVPVFLSKRVGEVTVFEPIQVANKYNVPGFWDERREEYIKEPLFIGLPGQEGHVKHTPDKLRREKETMWYLKRIPELADSIPFCFESPDNCIVTEFRQGQVLETLMTDPNFSSQDRTIVSLKMMDFVYNLHTLGQIHHNDFHDKNVLVDEDLRITVLDFGMAGEKNIVQKDTWWDVNQMARSVVRLVLRDEEVNRRSLTTTELKDYDQVANLFKAIPFKSDEEFYEVYEQYGLLNLLKTFQS